jgi:uridine phosphorylase
MVGERPVGHDAHVEDVPLLEPNPTREAIIEPARFYSWKTKSDRAVLCFFHEVVRARCAGRPVVAHVPTENGQYDVYEYDDLLVMNPPIGASMTAAALEMLIAVGVDKVIACGGAGNLEADHAVGHLVVPTAAVRDEGTSYHYLPPARTVAASPAAVVAIRAELDARGVPYATGLTWTTDAIFRETRERVAARRREGCLTVEMEAAALFAVGEFRGATVGQFLYAGDDLTADEWDHRGWDKQTTVRERAFELAIGAVRRL